jgi:plastocyanin
MSRRIHSISVSAIVIGALAAACGGGGGTGTSSTSSGGSERPAATATADGPGVITGRISFEGEPPPRPPVRMAADPNCTPAEAQSLSETTIVAADGGLQNVFVHVKDGLGNRIYATPATPIKLDQLGCRYEPHVFGVFVGQPVEIHNSDPTLHNVHAIPKENDEFNFGQQPKTPPMTRMFDEPEIGVSFRCDVHGWMRAYANVVTHPFFAVSKADGTFEIKGLPAGTYTIEAWHERLGTQTQQVTITDGAPAVTAAFAFKPAA